MPIFTPHGLKIRLDAEAVQNIVRPLAAVHDMNDVFSDLELWENLPEGLVALAASATAFSTHSAALTLLAGLVAHSIGSFVRSLTYSDGIRRLFPMFLGSWVVSLIHTVIVSVLLLRADHIAVAVVLCVVNICAHLGLFGAVDFALAPVRVPLRRLLGLPPTHQETVFVQICNRRAASHGIVLDWSRYSRDLYAAERRGG